MMAAWPVSENGVVGSGLLDRVGRRKAIMAALSAVSQCWARRDTRMMPAQLGTQRQHHGHSVLLLLRRILPPRRPRPHISIHDSHPRSKIESLRETQDESGRTRQAFEKQMGNGDSDA